MIKKANVKDLDNLVSLVLELWPFHDEKEIEEEIYSKLKSPKYAYFIDYEEEIPTGFIEISKRSDYVEGTSSSPVGYLEGIYVKEEYRLMGIGRKLINFGTLWVKEKGCSEFASDCEIDNLDSLAFHIKMGFLEVSRNIHFNKEL